MPPGEYTVVLRNMTDEGQTIYASYLLEGKTYQTLINIQREPGRYWKKPDWVVYADTVKTSSNEERREFYVTFSLEEGEHVLYIGSIKPLNLWFCAPLKVTK